MKLETILATLSPDTEYASFPVNEIRALLAQNALLRGDEQGYTKIEFAFEPNAESTARLYHLIVNGYQLIRKGEVLSSTVFDFLEAYGIKASFETQTMEGKQLWKTRN